MDGKGFHHEKCRCYGVWPLVSVFQFFQEVRIRAFEYSGVACFDKGSEHREVFLRRKRQEGMMESGQTPEGSVEGMLFLVHKDFPGESSMLGPRFYEDLEDMVVVTGVVADSDFRIAIQQAADFQVPFERRGASSRVVTRKFPATDGDWHELHAFLMHRGVEMQDFGKGFAGMQDRFDAGFDNERP